MCIRDRLYSTHTTYFVGHNKRLTGLFAEHYEETERDPLNAEHSVHRFLALIQGEIVYARNAGKEFPDKVVEEAFEQVCCKRSL